MLAAIIPDTVALEGKSLVPVLPEDTNLACFMQITEDHRCARSRRIDAGDNSAWMDFAAILLSCRFILFLAPVTASAGFARTPKTGCSQGC